MSDSSSTKVKSTVEAATALIKEVPIYQDAVQPIAKQTGKSLETVGRAVNAALSPLNLLVHGMEVVEEYLLKSLSNKFEKIPAKEIETPNPSIAVPAIQALRYNLHDEELCDLFSSLVASSMYKKTKRSVHPSFVSVISDLTSDEARIMKCFLNKDIYPSVCFRKAYNNGGHNNLVNNYSELCQLGECENPDNLESYIDNLERLGLIVISKDEYLMKKGIYDGLVSSDISHLLEERINIENVNYEKLIKSCDDIKGATLKLNELTKKELLKLLNNKSFTDEEVISENSKKSEIVKKLESKMIELGETKMVKERESYPVSLDPKRGSIALTSYGKKFLDSCIKQL